MRGKEKAATEKADPKPERGTFCGVIGKQIIVASCPLPQGTCMWKHRALGTCRYTDKELTVPEFCRQVGLPVPEPEVVNKLREDLRDTLQRELAT